MAVIVKVLGAAGGGMKTPHDDRWVMGWNPHVMYGTLAITSTADRSKAKKFATHSDATDQWGTVSYVQRTRPDGQPNKPLTAVSILIEKE